MIVALMGAAGCLLIVAGVYLVLGVPAALITAGVAFLAGAYVTNLALRASETPEGVR